MSLLTCLWCGNDAYVDADTYDSAQDLAYCTGPGHPEERMFQPKAEAHARKLDQSKWSYLSDGIAASHGMYESLPKLLIVGEWVDTNVVEHRFAVAHPEVYGDLLNRWGHVVQGPRRYSTSSFIGSTLGDLSRATNVTHKHGAGSGMFSYNSTVGFWTLEPVPASPVDLGWSAYAKAAGLDPEGWPFA